MVTLIKLSHLHTGKYIRRFVGIYAYCRYFIELDHFYVLDMHGGLCKHLEIDSSTDLDDRYSNLFLNAYINRHAHTEYLKMI